MRLAAIVAVNGILACATLVSILNAQISRTDGRYGEDVKPMLFVSAIAAAAAVGTLLLRPSKGVIILVSLQLATAAVGIFDGLRRWPG